jgi:uncharacterized protein YacL
MRIRSLLISLLSGAVAGFVIGGIGSRVAMRIIADSIGRFQELSFDTINVLLVGTIFGTVGGLIFSIVNKFLPRSTFAQGLVLAGVVFGIASVPFFLRPIDPGNELALNPTLGRILFSILFVAYGFVVPVMARFLDRIIPSEEQYRTQMTIATLLLGAPGLLGIGLMIASLFSE